MHAQTNTPTMSALRRSMQYMSARNGGLIVDFTPIWQYLEVAPGEPAPVRARTVLDWMAFGVDLGVLDAVRFPRLFENPDDLSRCIQDLVEFEFVIEERHLRPLEMVGLELAQRRPLDAAAAEAIGACVGLERVA